MRIVLKLGSSLLDGSTGINHILIDELANKIIGMTEHEFAIVTSGAISTGMKKLGMSEKPKDVATLQALAAVGQSDLMNAYEDAFQDRKILAQVLLTNHDFSERMKYLNIRNTLNALLARGIIPVDIAPDVTMANSCSVMPIILFASSSMSIWFIPVLPSSSELPSFSTIRMFLVCQKNEFSIPIILMQVYTTDD